MNWGMMFIYLSNAFHFQHGIVSVTCTLMAASPLPFYFSLTFIQTSGSLEWAICTCPEITQSRNTSLLIVRSEHFSRPALLSQMASNSNPPCSGREQRLRVEVNVHYYVHTIWNSLSLCLFIVCCFPNYEPSISMSLVINIISTLFNHIAHRHKSVSSCKSYYEPQSGFFFDY